MTSGKVPHRLMWALLALAYVGACGLFNAALCLVWLRPVLMR